jgi:DNA-binding transcriptional LysR family regulator
MQLAQIEAFLEIAARGNISRAAEALAVTQPALTARMQALEAELATPLFVRGRRGMLLTEAGRAFKPYAERALDALRDGREFVAQVAQGRAGELVIGAAPAVSTYVLPGLLVRFTARYPNVRLVVRTGHSEDLLELALRGDIQVGLVRELNHPLIDSRHLYEDELVLVAEPDHPLARKGRVRIERLGDERLILFDRTSSYFDLTNALLRQAGVAPRGVMELDNIDAAKQMVEQGLGVALLPHTAVAAELSAGVLRAVRVDGAAPIRRRIVAIRRRDAPPIEGVLAGFYGVLEEIEDVLPRSSDVYEKPDQPG